MKLKSMNGKKNFEAILCFQPSRKKMTNEQFEMIFAANYFGPFLLTHLLLGKFIFKICTLETRLI